MAERYSGHELTDQKTDPEKNRMCRRKGCVKNKPVL